METRGEFSNLFREKVSNPDKMEARRPPVSSGRIKRYSLVDEKFPRNWAPSSFLDDDWTSFKPLKPSDLFQVCRELFVQILCSFSIIERSLVFSFLLLLLLLYLWMIFFNSLKNKKLLFLLWNVIAREARGNDKYFRDVIQCSRTAPSH